MSLGLIMGMPSLRKGAPSSAKQKAKGKSAKQVKAKAKPAKEVKAKSKPAKQVKAKAKPAKVVKAKGKSTSTAKGKSASAKTKVSGKVFMQKVNEATKKIMRDSGVKKRVTITYYNTPRSEAAPMAFRKVKRQLGL